MPFWPSSDATSSWEAAMFDFRFRSGCKQWLHNTEIATKMPELKACVGNKSSTLAFDKCRSAAYSTLCLQAECTSAGIFGQHIITWSCAIGGEASFQQKSMMLDTEASTSCRFAVLHMRCLCISTHTCPRVVRRVIGGLST